MVRERKFFYLFLYYVGLRGYNEKHFNTRKGMYFFFFLVSHSPEEENFKIYL